MPVRIVQVRFSATKEHSVWSPDLLRNPPVEMKSWNLQISELESLINPELT